MKSFAYILASASYRRLEEILHEIILISEIAELAMESDNIAKAIGIESRKETDTVRIMTDKAMGKARMRNVRWSDVRFSDPNASQLGSDADLTTMDSTKMDGGDPLDSDTFEVDNIDDEKSVEGHGFYDSSSYLPIKDLLDRWEEPDDNRDKVCDLLFGSPFSNRKL